MQSGPSFSCVQNDGEFVLYPDSHELCLSVAFTLLAFFVFKMG